MTSYYDRARGSVAIGGSLGSGDKTKMAASRLFQKSLRDMITGIRAHKDGQREFINKCLVDVRTEVQSSDVRTKAVAIEKATYLHSLGHSMHWASFHVVELMSTQNVKYKRVGYLAASQSFGDDTDVVLLIPNLLKKDLASPNPAEAALALTCLGNIVTPELSQTLVADVYSLLNNHKPDLRRRACLCLYKCFLRYPEALRPSFTRLTECLDDDDQSVVQAAVTVLSELAMHNPKTYLPLAPKFYKLLTSSSSNWMTIKLVKVFGALAPLEPRLAKKLAGPISEILETTSAKSLMYECVRTAVMGMTSQEKVIRQAVDKLKDMLEDHDPNIKFLALHALTYLLDSHPRIVAEHKGNIFECLDHEDSNIQYCALKIVCGLVTKRTLIDTTSVLMNCMGKADQRFRDELVSSVIRICMNERYALVTDFVWYLSVLADLIRVPCSSHGALIGEQIIDVCLRVEVIREAAVGILAPLLLDVSLLEPSNVNKTVPSALKAVAWVVGEYAHHIVDHEEILDALLNPAVKQLPGDAQAVYVQAIFKVYASAVLNYSRGIRPTGAVGALPAPEPLIDISVDDDTAAASGAARDGAGVTPGTLVPESEDLIELRDKVSRRIEPLTTSFNLEVRERSCQLQKMLGIVGAAERSEPGSGIAIIEAFATVMSDEIQPVSVKAQRKIEVPAELLDDEPMSAEWDYLLVSSDEEEDDEYASRKGKKKGKKSKSKDKMSKDLREVAEIFGAKKTKEQVAREERESREMLAKHKEKMGQYYLEGETGADKEKKKGPPKSLPGPESAAMLALEARLASHAVGQTERPAIKGESDSESEEEEQVIAVKKGKSYDPKNASSRLHGELEAYNPLKPLERNEHLPTVEAYPRFDPYSQDEAAFNAFAPSGGDARSHHKDKKDKKKRDKKKKDKGAGGEDGESKEKKPKKEKGAGEKKSGGTKKKSGEKKTVDVDALAQSLMDAKV
ncbi:Clathrin/coatomer adaptor,adaptin-like,N-terminal [Ostreococcus tauri]|uniref:AP-3 complex subunit delta n=1 Tax=Ostreococcus tauri TaxID=70448 RepID=A0A096P9Y8_OSTTA|nr:Clathrin/coatomer adaptor,adaptin-like,N-terminal [Ostreococcus tauri]CEG00870.1 Clathrin/coatomer adaptor,adaptin-like,N-terminal [Ostreococcus tauri]|eukprot:XP_022840636.1 Clathrin/coatomer adaptor,adaptin-like,N-terminal [Ostreococcus tauri]